MQSGNKKKVMIVDDEPFVLKIICRALSQEGFECTTAASADAALQMLNKEIPDIILCDYQMPEMNGFEFRKKLMEDVRWKNIAFVFLTGFTDEEMMLKGLDMQVADYVAKDTPVKILTSKLNNIFHNIQQQHDQSIQDLSKAAENLNLRSVPQLVPEIDGFHFDFWHQSFQNHPGGDFIDFIEADENYTCVVLGDVMGKKWGAWVFSFSFLSYIRSAVRLCVFDGNVSTASILNKLNKVVCSDQVLEDVFSTLSLLMINKKEQTITYSGAGDLPLIHYKAKENRFETISTSGLLMGLMTDGQYDEQLISLETNDQLLVISDGIIDYDDGFGKKTDYDRLIRNISSLDDKKQMMEFLKNETFSKGTSTEQIDDCSIIIIRKEQK